MTDNKCKQSNIIIVLSTSFHKIDQMTSKTIQHFSSIHFVSSIALNAFTYLKLLNLITTQ